MRRRQPRTGRAIDQRPADLFARRRNSAPTQNIVFTGLAVRCTRAARADEAREATMNVSIILAGKGREVVTIEPNAKSCRSGANCLPTSVSARRSILGADRRIAGIISERDIVRALAERGAAALDEPVSRTMTRKVETCNESETRRQHHGAHDRRQISPHAGRRSGPAGRHRFDRRHRQASASQEMEREFGGDARLHHDGIALQSRMIRQSGSRLLEKIMRCRILAL